MDRVSKSSLATFLMCKRKYYYSLIGFKEEPNKYMIYGTEFHDIVNKFNRKIIKENNFNESINIGMNKTYKNNFDSYLNILKEFNKEGYNLIPYASELPVNYDDIFGFIDIILHNNGKYLIIDMKTIPYFNKFSEEKYRQELYLYAWLFSKAYNVELSNINTALIRFEQNGSKYDINRVSIDNLQLEGVVLETYSMKEFILNSRGEEKEFPKISKDKTSFVCKFCPYFKICD